MANQRLQVVLPPDMLEFVTEKVRSGEYAAEAEVIRDGLELLRGFEQFRAYRLKRLREEIQVGIDQANKGMCRPFDRRAVERIKSKGRRLLAARKNGKH